MKKYISPEIKLEEITQTDILAASDVLIDGSGLFDEQQ